MKKTSNYLSKMLCAMAFCGFAGTVSAQSLNAGGSADDLYVCSIGDALVDGGNVGFLAALTVSPEIGTAVKSFYAENNVQIQGVGNGKLKVNLPENLIAEGAYCYIYDASGVLLSKSDIKSANTTVNTSAFAKGKVLFVLVGTNKSGKLTSVKLMK